MAKQKWTERKVLEVIREARQAGGFAATEKLIELQRNGPQWEVKDGSKTVGTLLDVCGFANLKIPARGKFYLLAKKLSQGMANRSQRFICNRGYYGGGRLSIFDSTHRQEMSVNIASCKGQAEVLAKYGIEASIESRID